MKKWIMLFVITMLLTGSAMAQWQRNENEQDQGQAQGQAQGQLQGQAQGQGQGQGQMQGQAAIAAQGQIGINAQDQVANGSVSTSVDGDESDDKTYAASYPNLTGGENVSQANAYSVFGGVGLSQTENYKKCITQMQAIEANKILTDEEKKALNAVLVAKMMESNKKQRFLGLFWETSGRNALNLFGILSWDSFWKETQHPFWKIPKQK